jgi:hypothetical protein
MSDKILFWIDSNLLYIGIAEFLKEKYDAKYYAITDLSEQLASFFEEQKIIEFEKTWSFRDNVYLNHKKPDMEYLEKFEKENKIDLWKLAYSERVFYKYNKYHKYSDEELLEIFEHECRFFEKILDEIKPNYLIIKMVDYHHAELLCQICKSRGIKILALSPTRLGNQHMITEDAGLLDSSCQITFDDTKTKSFEELREYIKEYSSQSILHSKKFKSSKKIQLKASLQFFLNVCNNSYRKHVLHTDRTRFRVLKNELTLLSHRYTRRRFLNKVCSQKIDKNEKFIYFTLHSEPERALLFPAPFYMNQLSVIQNIAKSVPIGYKLYVKEHQAQGIFGWRSPRWYQDILKLPNVRLIHPNVSSIDLLKNCSLAISIGGTIGMEAAFFNKPSIVFADVIYSILKSVVKIDNITELPDKIKSSLNIKVDIKDLNRYIQTIENVSFQIDINAMKNDMKHRFYYDDYLREVKILEEDMEKFLIDNKENFELLANEHVKKIIEMKNNS